jgi:hypothetical protein
MFEDGASTWLFGQCFPSVLVPPELADGKKAKGL